jgi:hypothetical protein
LVEFVGNVNSAFKEYVLADESLKSIVRFVSHVPHAELLKLYGTTDLQLLVLAHTAIAPGNLPGKFFEYLASCNPILAIGPVDGDAAVVLKETGAGEIFERGNEVGIKNELAIRLNNWKTSQIRSTPTISHYTRRNLTSQLVGILD